MPETLAELNATILEFQARADWLPNWALVVLVVILFCLIGWAAHAVLFGALRRLVRNRDVFWRGVVERGRIKFRALALIIATSIAVTVSPLDIETAERIRGVLLFAFVLTLGWLASGVLDMWTLVYMRRFNTQAEDNLVARKHVTQTRILQRVAKVLLALVTVALALMTISGFRQWGVSLLASAGVVGIIAGLALQPLLTNLVAGIQIAVTQPIRIDDAVIVKGEFGRVEEIGSTYVVVRLWDLRRMVLPLSYFISEPFENWTRETASLIGSAFVYVDYEAPVDRLREAAERIVKASPHWDGDTFALQVTDVTDRVAQVRVIASARSSGEAFDLRCEIREKLLAFMRDHLPEALPRERFAAPQSASSKAAAPMPRS